MCMYEMSRKKKNTNADKHKRYEQFKGTQTHKYKFIINETTTSKKCVALHGTGCNGSARMHACVRVLAQTLANLHCSHDIIATRPE